MPEELRRAAAPVVVREGWPPSGLDQVAVYFGESVADLEPSRLRDIRAHLSHVPFEPGVLAIARIAARAWAIRGDQQAQLRMAEQVFQGHYVLPRMREFITQNPNAVLIAEQHALIVMRLLIERARAGRLEDGLSSTDVVHLQDALLGATSITDRSSDQVEGFDWTTDVEAAVAYFVQNGAYNRKPQPMGELTRSREIYTRIAREPATRDFEHYCPLDEWMQTEYGFDNDEQLSFGFALSAMTTTWIDNDSAGEKSYVLAEHVEDLMVKLGWQSRQSDALDLLSAAREWYADAFSDSGDSPEHVAWELRPFMQRPFLRLANGGLVLLSPRTLASWVSDGFHYRLLDAAQHRNKSHQRKTSRDYTAFAGNLLEQYCLELARNAFEAGHHPGGGAVYPEQPYGRKGHAKTSDVAVHIGTDLVLFEITASRLRADTLVLRDKKGVADDLERMVVAKVKQLVGCINALAKGSADIPVDEPQVLWEGLERVWPVVVTGGDVMQNEYVWGWIRRHTAGLLSGTKVQPLTLLNLEDFEALIGLAEHGTPLIGLLEHKTSDGYRDLELAISVRDDPRVPRDRSMRPSMVEEAFEAAVTQAQSYIDMTKGLPPDAI